MAKRVNKKFLTILMLVVLGLLASVMLLSRLLNSRDPQEFLTLGDQLVEAYQRRYVDPYRNGAASTTMPSSQPARESAESEIETLPPDQLLEKARIAYGKALNLKPNDPEIVLKIGDVLWQMTRYDHRMISPCIATWEAALEIDPAYLPAHQRLLDAAIEITELYSAESEHFARLQERASALYAVNNQDTRALAYQQIGVIGAWLAGKATPELTIEEHLKTLKKCQQDAPLLADVPRYIAKANLRLARDRITLGDRPRARQLIQAAIDAFENAPPAAKDLPEFLYQQYLTFEEIARTSADVLAETEQRLPTTNPNERHQRERKLRENLIQRAKASLEHAVQLVRKARASAQIYDRQESEILAAWASLLSRNGQIDQAKAVFDELLAKRPHDPQVRLAAARLRTTIGEYQQAAELLAKPVPTDDPEFIGYRARLKANLHVRQLVELTDARLGEYSRAKSDPRLTPRELAELRKLIEDGYSEVASLLSPENWHVLKLKGKMLLLLDGDLQAIRQAVRVLQRAYDKPESQRYSDTELPSMLARAYIALNETGPAKTILNRLLERYPGYVQARKDLVTLLLRDRQFDQAQKHVAALEQLQPNDPEVLGYQLLLLQVNEERLTQHATEGADPNAIARIKAELDDARRAALERLRGLPEDQPQQRISKARLLLLIKEPALAETLIAPLSQEELTSARADFPASGLLVSAYLAQDKRQDAQQLIERVLAKVPQNAAWKSIAAQVRGELTPEERRQLNEEIVQGIQDEVQRALYRYELLISQGAENADKALAVLQEAEKDNPNDGRLLERIWYHLLDEKKWDLVEPYTKKLAELDWDQAQGLFYKTHVKLAQNDIEDALRDAAQLARQVPEFSRTWMLLGQAQQRAGDYESAIASYTQALERQADNTHALLGLIECNLALGRVEQARRYVEQGMSLGRNSARFQEIARRIDEHYGDLEALKAATAQREQELQKDRQDPNRWQQLASNYLRLARMIDKTDPQGASEYLQKAISLMDEAIKKFPDELRLYASLANLLQLAGKPEQGLTLLHELKSREIWKDRPDPSMLLADYLEKLGPDALAAAEQAWMEALAKSRNSPQVQRALAAFYTRTGQTDKAVDLLTSLVAETKTPGLRRQLVDTLIKGRRYAHAEQLLAEMLKETPSDAGLLTILGSLHLQKGDLNAAENYLLQARQADPDYMPARYYLGRLKVNRGELTEALAELQAARDLDPSNPDLRDALADAYRRRNQLNEAAKELEAAVQAAPLRTDLRVKLIRFYMQDRRWLLAQRLLDQAKANPELADNPLWFRLECSMWLDRGDLQRAYDSLSSAKKLAPKDPGILKDLWDILLRAQGYDEVIKQTDELIAQLQADVQRQHEAGQAATFSLPWWLHLQRAQARKGQGRIDLAEREIENALSAADRTEDDQAVDVLADTVAQTLGTDKAIQLLSVRANLRWKIAMARLHLMRADWNNTIQLYDELLNQDFEKLSDRQKLTVLRLAGQAYHTAANAVPAAAAKAEQAYNRYLKELEQRRLDAALQLETLNNLALLLAEHPISPNPEKARAYSSKAYQLMRNATVFNPSVADTHGWILVLCGRIDEGIELLRAAAKSSPDACYHLGEAYARKGSTQMAWSSLTEAANLLQRFKAEGRFVDPTLATKISAALNKLAPATQPAPPAAP